MDNTPDNSTKIRFFTAIVSLLLSLFAVYSDDLINSDGILYIETAEAFLQGGLAETVKLYNWPFFSICIAFIHQLTQLPLELSAYLINILLFVLLTDSLVLLSKKTLANQQQLFIAALIMLCFITLNDYRSFVIRDIGYWAFCLLGLYRFIKFIELPSFKNATFWQLAIITATLFRIEGAILLVCLPLYALFTTPLTIGLKQWLKLNYVVIFSLVIGSIVSMSLTGFAESFGKLATVVNYIEPDKFLANFTARSSIVEHQVLNKYSADYSGLILSSGLLVMLFYKLIKALTVGYLALYIASHFKYKLSPPSAYRNLFIYFFLINIGILAIFMFNHFFTSKRYAIIAILALLLLLLPRLCQLIQQIWQQKKWPWVTIIALVLTINFVAGITKSNSKRYVKNTAIWASQNLPAESKILTDDEYINYYYRTRQPEHQLTRLDIGSYNNAYHRYEFEKITSSYQQFDYLILVEKRKNKALPIMKENMQLEPIFSQQNARGDKASVYQVISASKDTN